MLRLFGWLLSRPVWVAIGVIALILLIWYAGPQVSFGKTTPLESVSARCWIIGLILAYFLLRFLLARWRAGRMNERVANMLRSTLSPEPDTDGTQGVLRDRFSEALNVLRKARFEKAAPTFWDRIMRRGRYVYELPWYVIIGAPGVGKTTALLNSGLSFPLSKQIGAAAIRGVGGTRNCDWWFTNEAVFIDTAGRYTTHETDAEADKAEWRGFLSMLKRNRNRQPVNGVLLMLSVSDLLGFTPDERKAYAATMRARLDELRADLGMSFPVYLMINKCDLLLGFNEYFSALDRYGRAQVWGYTLPLAPNGAYAFDQRRLDVEFDLLQERVFSGLVDVLLAEPDLDRRESMYSFPQQFSVLTLMLKEIASELLSSSRFSASPFLRGIYFTSATQEGTPFDRIVHALGQQGFEVRPPQKNVAGEGKAYFIQELLSKVVFSEAHLAGSDKRAEQRSYAFHAAAYALSVFALCGMALAWTKGYGNNLEYIAEVDRKADKMSDALDGLPRTAGSDMKSLLPVLDKAKALPDSEQFNFKVDDPDMRFRFGLYQGKALKGAAQNIYFELLTRRLRPALKANLEQKLSDPGTDGGSLYSVLMAYLMLHDPEHFDRRKFSGLFGNAGSLPGHVEALYDLDTIVPDTPINEDLVNKARQRLEESPERRIYNRMKRQLLDSRDVPGFSVVKALGQSDAANVFVDRAGNNSNFPSIPALYTVAGYDRLLKPWLEHDLPGIGRDDEWVLGPASRHRIEARDIRSGKLALAVRRLYVDDYIRYYEEYLRDVTVRKPKAGLEDTLAIISTISGSSSPLAKYYKALVVETTLYREPQAEQQSGAMAAIEGRVRGATGGIGGILIDGVASAPEAAKENAPEIRVNESFAWLHEFTNGGALEEQLKNLGELGKLANRVSAYNLAGRPGNPPSPEESVSLQYALKNAPGQFQTVTAPLMQKVESARKGAEDAHEKTVLINQVTNDCRAKIAGKYPFGSGADVPVAAFEDIFKPGGVIDRYRSGHTEEQETSSFKRARLIKETFFRNGSSAQIDFDIEPVEMDGNIGRLTLYIGSRKVLEYTHDDIDPVAVVWSASQDKIRLHMELTRGRGIKELNRSGFWALNHLFEGAARGGEFTARLNVEGIWVSFRVRPKSSQNPFNRTLMSGFACPQSVR